MHKVSVLLHRVLQAEELHYVLSAAAYYQMNMVAHKLEGVNLYFCLVHFGADGQNGHARFVIVFRFEDYWMIFRRASIVHFSQLVENV